MKPVIHYDTDCRKIIMTGERASVVIAEDHYNNKSLIAGERVSTSTVLSYDEATGIFETRNTTYVPAKLDK